MLLFNRLLNERMCSSHETGHWSTEPERCERSAKLCERRVYSKFSGFDVVWWINTFFWFVTIENICILFFTAHTMEIGDRASWGEANARVGVPVRSDLDGCYAPTTTVKRARWFFFQRCYGKRLNRKLY